MTICFACSVHLSPSVSYTTLFSHPSRWLHWPLVQHPDKTPLLPIVPCDQPYTKVAKVLEGFYQLYPGPLEGLLDQPREGVGADLL